VYHYQKSYAKKKKQQAQKKGRSASRPSKKEEVKEWKGSFTITAFFKNFLVILFPKQITELFFNF
jgi:hypothetical protein